MKFETVVYEKLIEILRKNNSIYDSSMNEHKDFFLQNNNDALNLANLAESDAILILSKVAPVVTVSKYSWWCHLWHGNAKMKHARTLIFFHFTYVQWQHSKKYVPWKSPFRVIVWVMVRVKTASSQPWSSISRFKLSLLQCNVSGI